LVKMHDQLEETHGKYKEAVKKIQFLYHGLKKDADYFKPNTKPLARAAVYELLSLHTEDPKMECRLLKKSEDFRREYRSVYTFGDIKTAL
jgi:hypothetical protein